MVALFCVCVFVCACVYVCSHEHDRRINHGLHEEVHIGH